MLYGMLYGRPPPRRCRLCDGTGEGQTVVTSKGMYNEPCHRCEGTGQLRFSTTTQYPYRQRPYGQA